MLAPSRTARPPQRSRWVPMARRTGASPGAGTPRQHEQAARLPDTSRPAHVLSARRLQPARAGGAPPGCERACCVRQARRPHAPCRRTCRPGALRVGRPARVPPAGVPRRHAREASAHGGTSRPHPARWRGPDADARPASPGGDAGKAARPATPAAGRLQDVGPRDDVSGTPEAGCRRTHRGRPVITASFDGPPY